ncbi:Putative cytoplasmic protein [Oxalobacteraceae bacterium IMCC9480]|nr:Putative cytoplasmic protein [Oxalobacteraceae bacterium IMCC9480]NDP59313.1 DUF1016 domain-containing protein [Oxalobacteraceae bacterium]
MVACLEAEHGRGFGTKNLRHMLRFGEVFGSEDIVYALSRQLSWTHFDLLFYNRRLRRLVAIELKLGEFKAAYKGQMELYLRWLAKYEQEPGEAPPLGIILCTGKNSEQIELLELGQSGIHVAGYLTGLPSRQLLEQKLHEAVTLSKARLDNRPGSTSTERFYSKDGG